MMAELAKLLATRDIPFHATHNRIMCFPHVINLCSQDVIQAFSKTKPAELDAMFADVFDDPAEKNTYMAAVAKLPVDVGRDIVRCIRSSGLRRDEFVDIVQSGNERGWFRDPSGTTIKVPEQELLRDVVTRWDSTFFMINRLRVMRPPVDHFLVVHSDLSKLKLDDNEWGVMKD
ncbi:hypothetical protein BU15DRAFT_9624, partial [Melanogaster broomeanus]